MCTLSRDITPAPQNSPRVDRIVSGWMMCALERPPLLEETSLGEVVHGIRNSANSDSRCASQNPRASTLPCWIAWNKVAVFMCCSIPMPLPLSDPGFLRSFRMTEKCWKKPFLLPNVRLLNSLFGDSSILLSPTSNLLKWNSGPAGTCPHCVGSFSLVR